MLFFHSLPNDKILDWFKLKAFADDKINVTEKLKFVGWLVVLGFIAILTAKVIS